MSLTKEDCERALEILKKQHDYLFFNLQANYPYTIEKIKEVQSCFKKLVNEHFDNPPLKFEELKENMWVWDRHHNDYFHVCTKKINDDGVKILGNEYSYRKFEENKLYRMEVKDDE